jgi:CrcB protein
VRSDKSKQTAATGPVDSDAVPPEVPRRRTPWRPHRTVLAVIAAGGAVGSVARYEAGLMWPAPAGSFPLTTFVVNVVGCLVIGAFLVAVTEIWSPHPLLRPFLGTGVLGGFTTFSTYCVDIERLVDGGHAGTALAYLAGTVAAALAAVSAGAWSTRRIWAKRSGR